MTEIKLNSLVVDGISSLGFDVGMQKHDIETILGKSLGEADVETDDVSCYLWEMDSGIVWSIFFDKEVVGIAVESAKVNHFYDDSTRYKCPKDLLCPGSSLHKV